MIDFCFNQDEVIANHAIAKLEKSFKRSLTPFILQRFGDNEKKCYLFKNFIYLRKFRNMLLYMIFLGQKFDENWFFFTMGLSGRERYEQPLKKYDENYKDTITKLTLMWDYQPLFLDNIRIEAIDFIKLQK